MSERRELLLAAACRVIARHGVRGLRVEDVATEAKSSTALIYYHFRDRAGLITQTMEFVNDRAEAYPRPNAGQNGYERLINRMISEFQDDVEVRENSAVWGEIRSAAVFDASLRPIVAAATETWNSDLANWIREGQADGSIPEDITPDDVALRLTALVEGLSNRWLSGLIGLDEAHRQVTAAVDLELRIANARDGLAANRR
ncbi:MAG: TetR family transcriptional regulator C-terminal domain-containing protein [Actinomycetota bacterium]|nr:TetR family transcriptional regulator C-terminal domain-containing protein [Actinomycetota bacterium]